MKYGTLISRMNLREQIVNARKPHHPWFPKRKSQKTVENLGHGRGLRT